MYWLTFSWWSYLLDNFKFKRGMITKIICRTKGHPKGVVWFSNNLIPDMHCKNCNDWLS